MFLQIERSLVASKSLFMPCIYMSPDLDKQMVSKLKEIAKRHQGTITDDEDDATHVIVPPTEESNEGRHYS